MCEAKEIFKPFFVDEKKQVGRNIWVVKKNINDKTVKYHYKYIEDMNVLVYMNHDEHMGTVYHIDSGYVSPNMPKLKYAYNFRVRGLTIHVFKELSPYVKPYEGNKGYMFIKRDGFNLIFYKPPYLNYKLTPKTRLMPMAGKNTTKLIQNEFSDDLLNSIENLVNDGYIPIFEVWGPKLLDYDIVYGQTNVERVIEIEGLDADLIVDLIALRINDGCSYPFVPPKTMIDISKEYGLQTPPYKKIDEITGENVYKFYEEVTKFNEKEGTNVYEGYVLHAYDNNYGYLMAKVKSRDSLIKDVALKNSDNAELLIQKVRYEVSKVLNEHDPIDLLFDEYNYAIKEIVEYIKEDLYKGEVPAKLYTKIIDTFHQMLTDYLINIYGDEVLNIIKKKSREYKKTGQKLSNSQKELIRKIFGSIKY